ncbi:MAG: endonuclease/exonuclease/phosphatase family protein [Bdellovibrionaceae bacterium]|nr:endonuclease/exonuclease/phosphatase family protein [Pseudobdellovibrionaceae bacterium]
MFSSAERSVNTPRLRVLTYNIHSCIGTDRRYEPARVLEVIQAADADIVALQEVDSSLEVFDGVDQLEYFARETGMHAVMGPTLRRHYGAYGNAFLSRFPLSDVDERDLTYRRFEPRGLISARIYWRGMWLRLVNTHLGLKAWERRFQVDRVLEYLQEYGTDTSVQATLAMGDFNEWFPWSRNTRRLARHLGAVSMPKTFPSRWPRLSLDRIYIHPAPAHFMIRTLEHASVRVASDHLPVVAEVELPNRLFTSAAFLEGARGAKE